MSAGEVGTVEMYRMDDGSTAVLKADPVIAVTLELLLAGADAGLTVDGDVLVFAEQARYRPVKWDLDMQALICWQVAG